MAGSKLDRHEALIVRMRKNGCSYDDIAIEVNSSVATLKQWINSRHPELKTRNLTALRRYSARNKKLECNICADKSGCPQIFRECPYRYDF